MSVMSIATVRVNVYAILQRAVEEGVAYGYQRAHKHTETPTADEIKLAIEDATMAAIGSVLNFDESDGDQ